MQYPKSKKYDTPQLNQKIMGPNPLKLTEELMLSNKTAVGATVMDLGSGQGLTSVFLAKEYGFKVYAADLWSQPTENQSFFAQQGLSTDQILAVKADATNLPFDKEFFDAVVCVDSYNYFGRDKDYLDDKLLPFVKKGGYVYICVPGLKKDIHDNLPKEITVSWTAEQMEYMHDTTYWQNLLSLSVGAEIIFVNQMQSNIECWQDWIQQTNPYAVNDKKAIDAGACKYLNFIAILLQKR